MPLYTLDQLADEFGLSNRTARYYIETVLPKHHQTGPGKLAQYGQETFNCFKFIQKAKKKKLTLKQIKSVLSDLDQEQIDRVASGEEDLTIVPMASGHFPLPSEVASASRRSRSYLDSPTVMYSKEPPAQIDFDEAAEFFDTSYVSESAAPNWQVLYKDADLKIAHKGHADSHQKEQIQLIAKLIKTLLRRT